MNLTRREFALGDNCKAWNVLPLEVSSFVQKCWTLGGNRTVIYSRDLRSRLLKSCQPHLLNWALINSRQEGEVQLSYQYSANYRSLLLGVNTAQNLTGKRKLKILGWGLSWSLVHLLLPSVHVHQYYFTKISCNWMELEGSTNTPTGLCHLDCLWICLQTVLWHQSISLMFFRWGNNIVPVRQCPLPLLKISLWMIRRWGRETGWCLGFVFKYFSNTKRNKQGIEWDKASKLFHSHWSWEVLVGCMAFPWTFFLVFPQIFMIKCL